MSVYAKAQDTIGSIRIGVSDANISRMSGPVMMMRGWVGGGGGFLHLTQHTLIPLVSLLIPEILCPP